MQLIDPHHISAYIHSFGPYAPVVFVAIFIVATIFFAPSIPFMVTAGILFGPLHAFLYIMLADMISGSIAFVLARRLGEPFVDRWLKGAGKKFQPYEQKLTQRYGWLTVLVLRLVPVFPYPLVNYGLGLTHVSFAHYFIGTFLGIIPAVFAYTYFGAALVSSISHVVIALVVLGAILLAGRWYVKRHPAKV